MNQATQTAQAIRMGVFRSLQSADAVVHELRAAGFTDREITVVCSSEAVQRHFAEFEHQDPAGTFTPRAALTGGACGAGLASLAAVALTALGPVGGVAALAIGGVAAWGGGVVGGLVGAMMTRGHERELADYYDQAVAKGRILVAAEQTVSARQGMLAQAEAIFARHNVEPLRLRES